MENNFRKNEETEPKQKQHPVVDVTGGGSKVQCFKEQYCIGTWNVRSMSQGKLEVVKQETAREIVDILAISELKWTGLGHHSQQKNPKCSSRVQSQKQQNDLCSCPRQTIQYYSNPSLCRDQ